MKMNLMESEVATIFATITTNATYVVATITTTPTHAFFFFLTRLFTNLNKCEGPQPPPSFPLSSQLCLPSPSRSSPTSSLLLAIILCTAVPRPKDVHEGRERDRSTKGDIKLLSHIFIDFRVILLSSFESFVRNYFVFDSFSYF